jgi:hypothetical protein
MPKQNYDHLSRGELISILKKRDASRRLELVSERDEVEHERALNDDFVSLDIDSSLSVGAAPHKNLVPNPQNHHLENPKNCPTAWGHLSREFGSRSLRKLLASQAPDSPHPAS